MSAGMPRQSIPVIIKGRKSGIILKPIEIQANSVFEVTQPFQSQTNDWIQSDSDFLVGYIESIVVGEMGDNQQFCQTSSMAHPLTYEFKGPKDANIFTIKEVYDNLNFYLQISVELPNNYFHIIQTSEIESKPGDWQTSVFDTADYDILAVEVLDSNGVPVCRLVITDESDIYLNLEPTA